MTMTASNHPSRIGYLLLARLLMVGDKGDTAAKIKKDIEPLLAHRSAGAVLDERIDRALSELEVSGQIVLIRGKSKKSVPRIALTDSGRRHALDFLHIAELQPKTTWAKLKKIYLPARALKLAASSNATVKALSSDSGFKALLLKDRFDLATNELPKLDEALDALAWKLIGFGGSTQRFDPRTIKTALFSRELGNGRVTDFKKAATNLLVRKVAARRDDSRELRDALLRGWIDDEESPEAIASAEHPVSPTDQLPSELDLQSFAARVKATARTCPTGRFGDNKVFIAHVWRAIQTDPAFRIMDLASFKYRLAEANHSRYLDLSRADLVQAMNPDDVEQSETRYLNATFHFVRI